MSVRRNTAALFLLCAGAPSIQAQFSILGRPVQVHGFGSQGFALSDNNNYLTMHTSVGSVQFTDGGLNASIQVTDKFRIGAQVYVRDIGKLGQWHPQIDWAFADYQFKDWLGIRGGKVKTVFGLYTDTQDTESLHTWAILPQSLYPLDLRSTTISHLGGDLYGEIPLRAKLGSLAYTAYAGKNYDDKYGGYRDVTLQAGNELTKITGWMSGGDLRWNNLTPGLTIGASWLRLPVEGQGSYLAYRLVYDFSAVSKSSVAYADYQRGNLHVNGEYTRVDVAVEFRSLPNVLTFSGDSRGWYAAIAYRVHPKLELGTYHSRFVSDARAASSNPANHIYDQAITARFDINRHWNFKVEGHIMDGYGSPNSARGFYLFQNPNGLDRSTNLFVLRTGYTF